MKTSPLSSPQRVVKRGMKNVDWLMVIVKPKASTEVLTFHVNRDITETRLDEKQHRNNGMICEIANLRQLRAKGFIHKVLITNRQNFNPRQFLMHNAYSFEFEQ